MLKWLVSYIIHKRPCNSRHLFLAWAIRALMCELLPFFGWNFDTRLKVDSILVPIQKLL